jgi:tRNA-binding protein
MNPAPIKPLISTSDLDKIDVRVGTILAVEDVAHSEKLVRLARALLKAGPCGFCRSGCRWPNGRSSRRMAISRS